MENKTVFGLLPVGDFRSLAAPFQAVINVVQGVPLYVETDSLWPLAGSVNSRSRTPLVIGTLLGIPSLLCSPRSRIMRPGRFT